MKRLIPTGNFAPFRTSSFRLVAVVFEHERALLFRHGHIVEELPPGRHTRYGSGWSVVTRVLWPTQHVLGGQEILTRDGAPIRVSVTASTRLADIRLAYAAGPGFSELLHAALQSALRAEVAAVTLEQLLAGRESLADRLRETLLPECARLGYSLESLGVRDLVLGGELKRAYYDRLSAQLQAAADLERARGEAATLRNLANSARMLREHPGLGLLRLMAGIEKGKATIVFGSDALNLPLIEQAAGASEESKPQ